MQPNPESPQVQTESMSDCFNDNGASAASEPIAVVGMAMRLPGGVHNEDDFWRMLIEKKSGLCEVPSNRYNVKGFHDPSGKIGTFKMDKAYFLQDLDIQQFDASFFSLPLSELERLDPAQRQLLEVTYECMENVGATSWRGSNIGCYVGVYGEDWKELNTKDSQQRGLYSITGCFDFALANRVSYEYDLHGPSLTVKTGSSSSMVCLDLACNAVRNGDCAGALVCGVSLIFSPTMTLLMSDAGVLSPSGTSKTFDASADGYGRGEAVNAVYIKKLSQALQDGDSIRAVLRATSVNTDGRTNGMLTPNPIAQEAMIRRAYEKAGIADLSKTAMVECHGTGTAVGDRVEASAVGKCFGGKGVIMTSVKPNVGHAEGAAGLTSLIKAVLAIEHRQVPPNIFFEIPNPAIPFESCKLHVPIETEDWPQGRAERVSVNSFGVGGVNAHVIVESLGEYLKPRRESNNGSIRLNVNSHTDSAIQANEHEDTDRGADRPQLLLFSSHSDSSLNESIGLHRAYLEASRVALKDVAYTLANRRDHKSHRAYAVTGTHTTFIASASEAVKSVPRIAWIFTGQGSQWPEMGAELIDAHPVFQRTIRNLDKFMLASPTPFPSTIEEELRKPAGVSHVNSPEMGHALMAAVQIGLVELLRSWGVKPDLVLGHSSGEMAAAYASGAITAEIALSVATFRGLTDRECSGRPGLMAALGLGSHEVAPYMEPGVVVACENSQCSITISGDSEQVESVVRNVRDQRPGVLTRFLRVKRAFHSHHMLELGPSFEQNLLPFVKSTSPKTPFFSSVTGERLSGDGCLDAHYWRQNMESPVRFNAALRSALGEHEGSTILIEVGPHPALQAPIGQILRHLKRLDDVHLATLHRSKGCEESLLQLAGKLFQHRVDLQYSAVCSPGRHVSNLPRYAWKYDTVYWTESRVSNEWRFREHITHELLGARVVEVSNERWWRNKLSLEDSPWLSGHEVCGQVVFPIAGYISMVGEALRQLDGELSYTLRCVVITTGLVLEYGEVAELVTRMTPMAVDSPEHSPWYQFTISSHNGKEWVDHCSGEARASVNAPDSLAAPNVCSLARKVNESNWYSILKQVGLNYTGMFRGLQNISAAPKGNEARATIMPQKSNEGGQYAMHPAVIDQCFQLLSVSAYHGLGRTFREIAVPTFIGEIAILSTTQELHVTASLASTERGSFIGGSLVAQTAGQVVLHVKGFQATTTTNTDSLEDKVPLVAQMEWRQHADFAQLQNHMHPATQSRKEFPLLEELSLLCSIETLEIVKLIDTTPAHLVRFFHWIQNYIQRYRSGANVFISKNNQLLRLNRDERLARIDAIIAQASTKEYSSYSSSIYCLFKNVETIFTGETHPLHVLMEDGLLTKLYQCMDCLHYRDLIQTIAHTNPRLRVLEIGAGTGSTTVKILQALKSSYGERMYSTYTFTDISAGFFPAAKELLADEESIDYAILDISEDPVGQGFRLGSFDLIVGSNVVHVTPNLQISLAHLRSLLCPGGRLFLLEIFPEMKFCNYIMGFLPGWWLGADDNRTDEPYVSPERWAKELRSAGFQEPDAIVVDGIPPYQINAGIIASPENPISKPLRVSLLCYAADGPYVGEMKTSLESQGLAVDISIFSQPHIPCQDVISLLDLQSSIVHDFTEESFLYLVNYLKSLDAKMIWVTRASQIACENPKVGMTLGLARTVRMELSIELFTVEIDKLTDTSAATDAVANILLRNHTRELDTHSMNPDWEYAIVEGEILIPRLHWQTMSNSFAQSQDSIGNTPEKTLAVGIPGLLHTIKWTDRERSRLGHGEVLIQVKAIGLNFKDTLVALSATKTSASELGLEGCGIVVEVGNDVQNLSVGDRVMYMAVSAFTTHLTVPEVLCFRIDNFLTTEQAATTPYDYATATMALTDKANLQAGQSILIHCGCDGVGLAAIQIAQMLGAEVYCTVGNEEKAQYLTQNHNIPPSHIFASRDSSFLPGLMSATNNMGVDVVFNSLSGPLLHASWKCVAAFGTMIEIGQHDFQQRAKLPAEAVEQNRTLVGIDVRLLVKQRPEKVAALMERFMQWMKAGSIKPCVISAVWEADQVQEAFRFLQSGRHIGKTAVNMPEDPKNIKSVKAIAGPRMRPDRSYLLVDGLGSLGRAIATWMVEQGARHISFLSRSATVTPELQDYVDELASQDCQVQLIAGDVSNFSDVEAAVKNAQKSIAGIINLSMALQEKSFDTMSFDDWSTAVSPKTQGTWNLHNLAPSDLDFFILCSSLVGIFGQPGRSNCAAASTFLDAFVQYRHHQGLPASVVDIGTVGETGFTWKNQGILESLHNYGVYVMREQDVLNAVNLAIHRSQPLRKPGHKGSYRNHSQILIGLCTSVPLSSPQNRLIWKRDVRMSIYHNINDLNETSVTAAIETASSQERIQNFMASAEMDPTILEEENITKIISRAVASTLAAFLIRDEENIKLEDSLNNIGVDSLAAMELSNWIRQIFGVEATAIIIAQSSSLLTLGEYIRIGLVERFKL